MCPECGKAFTDQSNLKQHRRVHEDSGELVCSVCGKQLSTASNLQRHMHIHQSDRKFVCAVCGRGFFTNRDLLRHERLHTRTTDMLAYLLLQCLLIYFCLSFNRLCYSQLCEVWLDIAFWMYEACFAYPLPTASYHWWIQYSLIISSHHASVSWFPSFFCTHPHPCKRKLSQEFKWKISFLQTTHMPRRPFITKKHQWWVVRHYWSQERVA